MSEAYEGRTALVTGAARGMGREISARLVGQGARVVGFDVNETAMKEAARELGPAVVPFGVDITDFAQVGEATRQARELVGPVHILVNNAGIFWLNKAFADTTPEDWQPEFAVNLYGTLHCTRAVIGDMKSAGWGRVVNIISDAGRVGVANQTPYCAAKAAVAGFSRALAKEVGKQGITVNCVSMGPTLTPATQDFLQGEALTRREKATPLGRLGKPRDAAGAVMFLTSDDGSWITGQTLSVNGGMNMLP